MSVWLRIYFCVQGEKWCCQTKSWVSSGFGLFVMESRYGAAKQNHCHDNKHITSLVSTSLFYLILSILSFSASVHFSKNNV